MGTKTVKADPQAYQSGVEEIRKHLADSFDKWAREGVHARMNEPDIQPAPKVVAASKRVTAAKKSPK